MALEIACAIYNDLVDRNGIGDELAAIDDEIVDEMMNTWCNLIQEIA